jgi:hypothetical protein
MLRCTNGPVFAYPVFEPLYTLSDDGAPSDPGYQHRGRRGLTLPRAGFSRKINDYNRVNHTAAAATAGRAK